MLVLDRNPNEEIVVEVDGEVLMTVTAVRTNGSRMKLGFTAPREVVIHRREVYEAIEREREREAQHGRLSSDEHGDIPAVRQSASDEPSGEQEGRKAS